MAQQQLNRLNTHHTIRWEEGRSFSIPEDDISPESPLAIRLIAGINNRRKTHELAITMRTDGQDEELVIGYLFAEGIIGQAKQITSMRLLDANNIEVHLHPSIQFSADQHQKNSYSNSACGLCSKTSLDQLDQTSCYFPTPGTPFVEPIILNKLSKILYQQQSLFKLTGGMHAAALFSQKGELLLSREDVGRHNAMDKLLGASLRQGLMPWRDKIVFLSSRLSFELVQKAAMAGTPILAAIGAPSTLAIKMAEQSGMSMIGFLRNDRFNVYTYPERVNL